jgi:hypothetical protein
MSNRPAYVPTMRDLSFFVRPPEDGLMGMITAYMDDSGHERDPTHNACLIGGFVGDMNGWGRLERYWPVILKEYGLSQLHMKDHAGNKLLMRSSREGGVPDILDDLLNLIRSCGLRAIANTVRLKDVEKFRQETGVNLSIRALSIYIGMINIWQQYGSEPVEVKLDNFDRVDTEICLANQYARTVDGWDLSKTITLNRAPDLARNMPAMQAADLLAWEARRHHSQEEQHLSRIKPPSESDDWREWFLMHNRESRNDWPSVRPSMRKVLTDFICFGAIIDYTAMMKIHEAREGRWGY